MKLSNKILVGFFGFAFIYLTAVFAEVRLRGTPNIIDDTNSIAQTVDISGVDYLVLQDLDQNIAVIGSDHARLEVRSITGDLLQRLNYKISGDTLTLSDLQYEAMKTVRISVFVPKARLKGITVNAAGAVVNGLEQELFHITQNAGRIRISDSKIRTVELEASGKSQLDISTTTLDTLSARIDDSQVFINAPVGLLRGSMKNKSFLRMGPMEEIQFKMDKTSRLN